MKKVSILALVIIGIVGNIQAQQRFTSYYLDNTIPSSYFNPAIDPDNKVIVGLPVIGSVGIGGNTGSLASLKSMMTIDGSTATIDLNRYVKKMNNVNFLTTELSVDVLSAMTTVRDNSYSLSLRTIADARIRIPKGLFSIVTEGVLDEPAFKKFGGRVNVYHELGLGFAHHNDHSKFNYGGRFKLLFGLANASADANIDLKVDDDDLYQWDLSMDAKVRAASVLLQEDAGELSASTIALGGGNMGMGLDVGATYKWDEKITFAASITDFGFIRWKTNPVNMSTDASYRWEGVVVDMSEYDNLDSLTEGLSSITDEIADEFEDMLDFDSTNENYTTSLFTKIYLTSHYQVLEKTRVSGTIFTEFDRGVRMGWAIAGTQDLGKGSQIVLNYWRWRNSGSNVGFGVAQKMGPIQLHVMVDNLWFGKLIKINNAALGGSSSGKTIPMPFNFRNADFRIGLSLVFGQVREPVKQSNSSLK